MRTPLLLASLLAVTACNNAGEGLNFPPLAEGGVFVAFFLDRDGSGDFTPADTVFEGARIALLLGEGIDTVQTAVSDAEGVAEFTGVPVGTYQVKVDRAALGDSIAVVVGDTGTFRLITTTDSIGHSRLIRLGYLEATIAEARSLPAGQRVFVRGLVTSPLQFFSDASSHITAGTSALRITEATHRPGRTGNNLGDSVSVLGTTGTVNGQPVLLNGLIATLGQRPAPPPIALTLAQARTADGGARDAALVELPEAVIADTSSDGEDFVVRIATADDTVSMVLDPDLDATRSSFRPGRTLRARGVLVPVGDGTWVIKPRPVAFEVVFD